jgi:dephospho-CoA kinase
VTLRTFGLTGGIGSGKTTVASRFRARGLPVLDSDELARAVVARGTEGLSALVAELGPAVLTPEGDLDRAAVARTVFTDPDARRRVEAITHPRIQTLRAARLTALEAQGEPLACLEIPLLVEVGLTEALRPLVVVWAGATQQLRRAAARDGAPLDVIAARIEAQIPLEQKVALADHVIDNDGALNATLTRADEVLDAVARSLGVDPSRYPRR